MGRFLKATIVAADGGADIRDDIDDAKAYSASEQCPALSIDVHDDDILTFTFFQNGKEIDSYNSCPGFFDDSDTTPSGGDAKVLAVAFGRVDQENRIEEILRYDSIQGGDEDRYTFASERLAELLDALGVDASKLDL